MNAYQKRRLKLVNSLQIGSVMLLHSGNLQHKSYDEFYPFYPSMNFYYLTGIAQDNVILMMVKSATSVQEFLFIEETTEYMQKWLGEKLGKDEVAQTSGITETSIFWIGQFASFFHNMMHFSKTVQSNLPTYLYLDLFALNDKMIPIAYSQFDAQISNYKNLSVKNVNEYLYAMRMIKDELELRHLQQAIEYTNQGLKRILLEIPNRSNEAQLEADFLHEAHLQGVQELSFHTIAASGVNATILHYEDNNQPLQKDQLILFDLGLKDGYYSADITRTYPLSGTFSDRQKAIYEVVLEANKKTIEMIKPGVTWNELNEFTSSILAAGAIRLGIIDNRTELSSIYYHSVGHYLGLDTHDVGSYGNALQEGMVITVEPGLYIKDEAIGIRIEDNVLVTKDGFINLSRDILKEIDEIEAFMKK